MKPEDVIISLHTLSNAYTLWSTHTAVEGRPTGQRWGQYVTNYLIPCDVVFPELFYEKDTKKAWELIFANFKIIP